MSALRAKIQRLLSTPSHVTEIEDLSTNIRRIRLKGKSIEGIPWRPGDKIKLAVGSTLRSYTPARVDARAGWMDVVFFLHGNGAASDWAASASVGDATGFLGPARSMPLPSGVPEWAVFLGDETAVGLAMACFDWLPPAVPVSGAIELAAEDAGALAALGLPLHPAIRGEQYGAALLSWLSEYTLPPGDGVIWISGEAGSVLALQKALLARGVARSTIKVKPYWSTKGHAHRKELQRQM